MKVQFALSLGVLWKAWPVFWGAVSLLLNL